LQRALSLLWFLAMQAMMRCSLPSEPMQNRMASELQADTTADRCSGVTAKLAVENRVATIAEAVATLMWRKMGWIMTRFPL